MIGVMQEHRRFHRTQVYKAAKLITSFQGLVSDCIVRDISVNGARLALRTTAFIPDTFDLTFDAARTRRSCRVVWRGTTECGVEFRQGPSRPLAWR